MGLKEKMQSTLRRKSTASNASTTSQTSETAKMESMAANDVSASKKERLHDVAEAAKISNPRLEAKDTVDKAVSVAPAVTHEIVKPHQHEEIEEQISREIHTYEVHQKIQPILDVEVLPARHLVPDEDGRLVDVSEEEIARVYRAREAAEDGGEEKPSASESSKTREDSKSEPPQRRYNLRSSSRRSE